MCFSSSIESTIIISISGRLAGSSILHTVNGLYHSPAPDLSNSFPQLLFLCFCAVIGRVTQPEPSHARLTSELCPATAIASLNM